MRRPGNRPFSFGGGLPDSVIQAGVGDEAWMPGLPASRIKKKELIIYKKHNGKESFYFRFEWHYD